MTILTRLGQVLKTDLTRELRPKKTQDLSAEKDLLHYMKQRRTVKSLGNKVMHSRDDLTDLIKEAVHCCPSALNSQSVRVVILTNSAHFQFWQMVKGVQSKILSDYVVESALLKIDRCSDAYGTVLFFEDQDVVRALQKQKPLQAADFSIWSEQTSGMAQFAVWTALSSVGLGAALQHYNPAIDLETAMMFDLPASWHLKAQLVFGSVKKSAQEKEYEEDETLFRVFHQL